MRKNSIMYANVHYANSRCLFLFNFFFESHKRNTALLYLFRERCVRKHKRKINSNTFLLMLRGFH